ncbi:MAG: cation diffusion facilitator family transporter [Streptococcaceae bacterium]|jgi:cation diffusion facilitator family transporter|nr:cation diffusion facilitator family transporter [Streptococcaceae bacterium]
MEKNRYEELKLAERGALVSILAYLILSTLKIAFGRWGNSDALYADGLNNFTDILGSIAVLIGLRIARRPADDDHVYGHWKMENIASVITSFIMFLVGVQVLLSAFEKLISGSFEAPDPLVAIVGLGSGIVMIGVYFYNHNLSKKVSSQALLAAAKDNLSDALSSFGTTIAIIASMFHFNIIDTITALVIGGLIIKTAYEIFRDNVFSLTDGFDEKLLIEYTQLILTLKDVKKVRHIRGRMYGANVYLDIVVEMDPQMTVLQSHYITEVIETRLAEEFGVFDTDVHVEPYLPRKKVN